MSLFGGGGAGNGSYSYPNIGVAVWCFFENGDQNKPVYFALSLGGDVASDTQGKGFDGVRENVVLDDDKNEDTTRTGQDAQQHGFTIGDCQVMMRQSGQIDMEASEKKGDKNKASISVTSGGIVTIKSSVSISLEAPQITINGARVQVNSDVSKITSTKEGCFQSQDLTLIGSNSLAGISPSIDMDASTGKFIAKGMSGQPLFAT